MMEGSRNLQPASAHLCHVPPLPHTRVYRHVCSCVSQNYHSWWLEVVSSCSGFYFQRGSMMTAASLEPDFNLYYVIKS